MELIRVFKAYIAVQELSKAEHPFKLAYALLKLKRKLEQDAEFYMEQEQKLIQQHALFDENGNLTIISGTTVKMKSPEDAKKYAEEQNAIAMYEVELEGLPLTAPAPERATTATLEALEGFIEFTEG